MLWGGSFFLVAIAVKELPAFTIVFARVGLAAVVLTCAALAAGLSLPRGWSAWWPYIIMGAISNAIPFSLIVTGQKEIASGLASVVNATTPLWSLLIAHHLTSDEKLTAHRLAGVLIGVAGVAILIGPEAMFGNTSSLFGMACCLSAALCYGFAAYWGRRFASTPPLLSSACQLVAGAALLAPACLLIDQPWTLAAPSPAVTSAIVALALLSTALGYVIFFHIMAEAGPQNATLVTLLVPLSAITLGIVFLGETLLARHVVGAAVIALSLIVIDGRLIRPVARSL